MQTCDLVVIGAGPAGMAAARIAAERGLSVVLLDEQARAGGQIYRDVDRVPPARARILGKDYTDGARLTAGLEHSRITHIGSAVVWSIEDGDQVLYTVDGRAASVTGKRILLATGALERPMPMPGWTLPGVMTAGAGQILLKQSGVVSKRAVLVGCGPLLYLIAAQMVRAGIPPLAMVETQTRADFLRSLRHIGGALRGWRYLLKGLKLLRETRRAGVMRYTAADGISISGKEAAEAVRFTSGGKAHEIECDTVYLHHGVVPNTQAARSIGVDHLWDAQQSCFAPRLDSWGRTSIETVYIAGDSAGIGGATVAALAGELAALRICVDLDAISQTDCDVTTAPVRAALRHETAVRPFLDTCYPPLPEALRPDDATIICRCEEVTAGAIRQFATLGCLGPNQAKAFGRAGMGPCQGRYCGLTVTKLLADAHATSPDQTGYFRIRSPIKPVTLGELAAMDDLAKEPTPERENVTED